MDFQNKYFWWIIILISLFTLTESRFLYTATNSHTPGRTHADIQPQLDSKQQQNEEFIAGPRPIVVNCYPDSMEVVVQADMFEKGLQVDGRHLRLGLDSAVEGSACGAVPSGEEEFTIRAHLMDCGTQLSVSSVVFMGCI